MDYSPTSKMVESFFSSAAFVRNAGRRAVLPFKLESQMIMFAHDNFWEVTDNASMDV